MPNWPKRSTRPTKWIVERTGIRSRYVAADGETTATLAVEACRSALEAAGWSQRHRPDRAGNRDARPDFPVVGDQGQALLGIDDCIAFDVHAVCTGFLYALSVADSMLRGGNAKRALVIGSETFSRILDWEDRTTCVLFGDGAGALVLEAEEGEGGSCRPSFMPTAAITACCSSTAGRRPPARSASSG